MKEAVVNISQTCNHALSLSLWQGKQNVKMPLLRSSGRKSSYKTPFYHSMWDNRLQNTAVRWQRLLLETIFAQDKNPITSYKRQTKGKSDLCEHIKGRVNKRLFFLSSITATTTAPSSKDTSSSFRKGMKSRKIQERGDSDVVMYVSYTQRT